MPVMGKDPDPRFAPHKYWGRCVNCKTVIGAETERDWYRVRDQPCPHCGQVRW